VHFKKEVWYMKLSCLQENLSRALAVVGRAVAVRSTLPITQNVLLATDGGRLKLSATNLEIGITTWIGAMIEEEGSITVPARLLTEFIGSLSQGQIEITGSDRPKSLTLNSGRINARISGTDAEDFPPIPTISAEEGVAFQVSTRDIKRSIDQTAFAADTEETRPVLSGILVEIEGDKLTLAAADGFRLAVKQGSILNPVESPVNVIIPARTFGEVSRLIGDQDSTMEVLVSSSRNQVLFQLDDLQIVSQIIQGNFPRYMDLLEDAMRETKAEATLRITDVLAASRSVYIFVRDSNNIVKLQMNPGGEDGPEGQIVISSKDDEVGENAAELDGNITGDESTIAFNGQYLLDVLGNIDGEEVSIKTSGPSRAGVFTSPGSDQYVHLIMPMFITR
jgi:DNA polymerase-3 subunit beta